MFVHSHIGCCNDLPSMGATIGITYDADVANWDVPGTEWYVPKPVDISCDAVDSYIALLNDYIRQWQKRLSDAQSALIKNRSKINNAQTMLNNLNQRLGEYNVRKDVCLNPPPVVVEPTITDGSGDNTGSGSGGSSTLLWVAIAAAGVFGLSKLKKRAQRRRAKK